MKARLLLLLTILLLSTSVNAKEIDWKSQAMECAGKYQAQQREMQKEIQARIKAEKQIEIEKEKNKNNGYNYLFKFPFTKVGITDEEAKGGAVVALTMATGQPLCLLLFLF